MRFLCDVHISYKLVRCIQRLGYEAIAYADTEDLVIITKDSDFRDSFFIKKSPRKLIKINLGNISNIELLEIFSVLLPEIHKMNLTHPFMVEVDKESINYITLDS